MTDFASASLPSDHLYFAPGLKTRKRKDGVVKIWLAPSLDAKSGFQPSYIAFDSGRTELEIAAWCRELWLNLTDWRKAVQRHSKQIRQHHAKAPPLPDLESYTGPGGVYFLQCQSGENHIKIGYSINPRERKETLETGCPYPVKMIAFHRGPPELERFLHYRFRSERVNGEWFLPSSEMRFFIENLDAILRRMAIRGRTGVRVPRCQEERPGTAGWNVR